MSAEKSQLTPVSNECALSRAAVSHVHVGVKELPNAVAWFEKVWQLKPNFVNQRMAVILVGKFILILDAAPADTKATIGFASDNCDRDYKIATGRGAITLEAPADQPWGSRAAYLKGPGALTIEIEQPR